MSRLVPITTVDDCLTEAGSQFVIPNKGESMMKSRFAGNVLSVLAAVVVSAAVGTMELRAQTSPTGKQNQSSGTQNQARVELTTDPSPAQKGSNEDSCQSYGGRRGNVRRQRRPGFRRHVAGHHHSTPGREDNCQQAAHSKPREECNDGHFLEGHRIECGKGNTRFVHLRRGDG